MTLTTCYHLCLETAGLISPHIYIAASVFTIRSYPRAEEVGAVASQSGEGGCDGAAVPENLVPGASSAPASSTVTATIVGMLCLILNTPICYSFSLLCFRFLVQVSGVMLGHVSGVQICEEPYRT